jgi:energy-coupling factor transport system permease protein
MRNLLLSIKEKLSVEYVKSQIIETAYGNRESFIARLDPRILFAWHLAFSILPWMFFNRSILIGIVLLTATVAALSQVSGFVLFLLGTGIAGELLGLAFVAMLLGGDISVFTPLSTLILKFLAVSLASIAVFSSMDPDRFSNGLLALGLPDQFSLGLSYGYRMVPILLEEYQRIFYSYRMRGKQPDRPGFLYWRQGFYFLRLMVRAFYPLMLNTALRTRTTVESLEIRGFTYALAHPEVKQLRLQHLSIRIGDIAFVGLSAVLVVTVVLFGSRYPL